MKKILHYISLPIKYLFMLPIYVYKWIISPCLPHTCRFTPTCSTYFLQAIKKFGIFKGSILGIKRLSRCTPRHNGGCDPLPVNLKGEQKWIF